MDAKTASALALRLLEMEQRFESYCTLHEEELKEIRSTLNQLRTEVLAWSRTLPSPCDPAPEAPAPSAAAGAGPDTRRQDVHDPRPQDFDGLPDTQRQDLPDTRRQDLPDTQRQDIGTGTGQEGSLDGLPILAL